MTGWVYCNIVVGVIDILLVTECVQNCSTLADISGCMSGSINEITGCVIGFNVWSQRRCGC